MPPVMITVPRRALASALLFSGACGLASCSDLPARVRKHTYPPGFTYIEPARLRSEMWQLAHGVNELDEVMRRPGPIDDARRQEIVGVLTRMEAAAHELQDGGAPSNHPMLRDHLGTFHRDLTLARAAVTHDPPSYYLAGTVAAACLGCHGPR